MKKHGRKWRNKGDWHFELEYNLLDKAQFCVAEVRLNAIDGCSGIQIFLAIPKLFDVWFTFAHPKLDKMLPSKRVERHGHKGEFWDMPICKNIGISLHTGSIWWALWETRMEWSTRDPWWWHGSFCPADFLLGKRKRFETDVHESDMTFPMPEGEYPVKVKQYVSMWKRTRWPKVECINMVDLDFYSAAPPVPGKGESWWDIDDDAVHSSSMMAGSIEDAFKKERNSILNQRLKYGGENWIPDKGWPV